MIFIDFSPAVTPNKRMFRRSASARCFQLGGGCYTKPAPVSSRLLRAESFRQRGTRRLFFARLSARPLLATFLFEAILSFVEAIPD
jgi:hypothetical protein